MKLDDINFQTRIQKKRLDNYRELIEDPDKEARLKEGLCQCCYYLSRIAGQAFSEYTCKISGEKYMWPNTAVPRIYPEVAKSLGLCYECGAQVEYRDLRKFPTPKIKR